MPETPRSRRRLIAACTALAVVIAVALAVVLLTRGSGSHAAPAPDPAPAAAPAAPVKDAAPPTAPRVRAITPVEMSAVLQAYVDAYSSEDPIGLRNLFADDLVRTNGGDPPEDLAQALDTYRLQFASLSNPVYRLSGVTYDAAPATAGAIYSISSDSGAVGGSIGFHFVRVGTGVLIDAITIQPLS